jgi:hypothetical protein
VVVYLNGKIDNKAPHAGEMMHNNKDLWFGASEFWDPRFFDGLMDDVALFNVALSEDDITCSHGLTERWGLRDPFLLPITFLRRPRFYLGPWASSLSLPT